MSDRYDVVVVGGGIHGVGVAQAAAAAGHRVLLLERATLASGTSSRSSKLIHGGLRYLERGRCGLVRECLRERALLLRLAPELVRLKPFLLPVYRTTRRRPWQLRIGLTAYAMLGRFAETTRFSTVPPREWDLLDGLIVEDLQCVFRYWDAQTDDARLTAAVMRSAESLGAELAAPARFVGAALNGTGTECEVEFEEGGRPRTCIATVLVNAAGPWAHRVLGTVRPTPALRPVDLVQGAHILVRGQLNRGIYYVESPMDGRAVFVMPWAQDTLVGTTETPYDGDPDDVEVLPDEQAYLTNILQHYFPRYMATSPGAVLTMFAGLRVLPAGNGRAFDRTRETFFDVDRPDAPRVLTIYGGKLTAYRATAETVIRRLASRLPAAKRRGDTRKLPLTPAD